MKLKDLDARLTKAVITMTAPGEWLDGVRSVTGRHVRYEAVRWLSDADGMWFDCPCNTCRNNAYPTCVCIGFEGRCPSNTYSKNSAGEDTRWRIVSGLCIDDLSLSPSIKIEGSCNWHGWIGSNGVPPGEAA